MNGQIILQGVEISSLLSQVREIIKEEVNTLKKKEELPTIGGIDHAVKVTGLSKQTIYQGTSKGTFPHIKRGGKLYFRTTDLLKWIEHGSEE